MTATVLLFLDTILPVLLVAGIGFAFARLVLDRIARESCARLRGLSTVGLGEHGESIAVVSGGVRKALHVLTFSFAGPAFVFTALRESELTLGALGMPAAVALIMYVILVAVAFALAAARRWDSRERKAAVLALASKNCGNYGLPVILFAFGEDGLVIGTIFMITHILVHMTLGLSIASWSGDHPLLRRLGNALRFPYVYAIGLALLLRAFSLPVPVAIERPLALIGQMWMPLMLVLLGVELAGIRIARVWRPAVLLSAIKLLLPPLLVYGLAAVFGITGLTRAVLILQASTPTAVTGLLVARQFDTRPDLVASTLLLTTLGSIITLSVLLALLT
ncbi:AEC family transporter [Candidatus Bipolaricaulota bacterium]